MKRAIIILGLLLLFAGVQPATMQGDGWPPDPAEIFAPNVEVISARSGYTITEDVAVESTGRKIWVLENGEWIGFPYDFYQVGYTSRLPDGRVTSSVVEQQNDPYTFWILDPQNGEFSRYEPCPGTVLRDQRPYLNTWVLAVDPDTETRYFCNQETSTRYDIPEALAAMFSRWVSITPSPQGDRLLLYPLFSENQASFYSYEPATGHYFELGRIQTGNAVTGHFEQWLDDAHALYWHNEYSVHSGYYVVDVTALDGLRLLVETDQYGFVGDPPRNEQVDENTLELYFLDTDEHQIYTLGTSIHGIATVDDVHYYAVAVQNDSRAALIQLDTSTGEQMTLLEGEIEMLHSLSPDGRYAALITDNTGQIDLNYEDWATFLWDEESHLTVTLYDLQQHEIVYETPYFYPRSEGPLYPNEFPPVLRDQRSGNAVIWLDPATAVVTRSTDPMERWIVQFDEDEITSTAIQGVLGVLSADQEQLSVLSIIPEHTFYPVYDLGTDATVPLFSDQFDRTEYGAFISSGQPWTIQVYPRNPIEGEPYNPVMIYQVRVHP